MVKGASPTIEENEVRGNAGRDFDVTDAGADVVVRGNKGSGARRRRPAIAGSTRLCLEARRFRLPGSAVRDERDDLAPLCQRRRDFGDHAIEPVADLVLPDLVDEPVGFLELPALPAHPVPG